MWSFRAGQSSLPIWTSPETTGEDDPVGSRAESTPLTLTTERCSCSWPMKVDCDRITRPQVSVYVVGLSSYGGLLFRHLNFPNTLSVWTTHSVAFRSVHDLALHSRRHFTHFTSLQSVSQFSVRTIQCPYVRLSVCRCGCTPLARSRSQVRPVDATAKSNWDGTGRMRV